MKNNFQKHYAKKEQKTFRFERNPKSISADDWLPRIVLRIASVCLHVLKQALGATLLTGTTVPVSVSSPAIRQVLLVTRQYIVRHAAISRR